MGDTLRRAHLQKPKEPRERRGFVGFALTLSFIVVTAETLIYPSQNLVGPGVFSFSVGSFNLRLVDLLVIFVSAAAVLSRPSMPTAARSFFWWLAASIAYTGIAAYVGMSNGAAAGIIFTQFRFLLYLALLAPLIRAVDGGDVLRAGSTALKWLAVPLLIAGVMSFANTNPFAVPGFPLSTLGADGGDIGSIVGLLSLCAVGKRATEGKASWAALWLLYPLVSNQRASILCTSLLGLVLVLVIWTSAGVFGSKGRRTFPAPAAITIVGVVSLLSLFQIFAGKNEIITRIVDAVAGTFSGQGKAASADTRTQSFAYAMDLIGEKPWIGHGLGKGVQFFDIFYGRMVATDSAHDFLADVLVRGGIVGLVLATLLFLAAVAGDRRWSVPRLVWGSILATLLTKGLLEPAFDKYRLVFLIALSLILAVASRTRPDGAAVNAKKKAAPRRRW